VLAERAFLAQLGGGCDAPVGAYATYDGEHLALVGFIADDEPRWHRDTGSDPQALGGAVANALQRDAP
jgi:hydroxymethylbilane synthase